MTACSKDVTIENESENSKNKKKKENPDETDGETVQMVIVNKKDTNTKNTITKDKNSKDKNTVTKDTNTKDTNTKDTNTKDKKDEVDGQTGQIVAAAKASSLKINKVLSRLRLMFILILFDADTQLLMLRLMLMLILTLMFQRPKYRDRMALEKEEWREEKLTKVSEINCALRYLRSTFNFDKGIRDQPEMCLKISRTNFHFQICL